MLWLSLQPWGWGEITCKPTQPRGNVIFLNQIVFMKNREGVVSSIKATLRNYKHSDPAVPIDIFLYRENLLCPVYTVLAYLGLRGTSAGPLFVGQMLRQFFALFSLRHYQTHFDIATSTQRVISLTVLTLEQLPGQQPWACRIRTQIRAFGRWKSNAFLRYIRTPSLGSESSKPATAYHMLTMVTLFTLHLFTRGHSFWAGANSLCPWVLPQFQDFSLIATRCFGQGPVLLALRL